VGAGDEFQRAVDRSPGFALAHLGLADAHAVLGFYYHLPPVEAFPAAREAARRALEIDPDLAQAHATLGYVALYHDWDWERADEAAPRRGWRPPRRRASVVRASSQDA
jgi:tetratricopeptide (TPR) repeat protein